MAGGGDGRAPKRRGLPSGIKNKVKRGEVHARVQQEKKKEKKQRVLKRKKEEEAAVALGEAVSTRSRCGPGADGPTGRTV